MNSFHRADWLALSQSATTLIAIIGAYGVAFYQHRLEQIRRKREAAEQARQYLTLALGFAFDAMRAVNVVFEFRSNPANSEANADRVKFRSRMTQCLEALLALQIEKIPTVAAVKHLIRARAELAYAINLVNVNAYGPGGDVACGEEYGKPLWVIVNRLQEATTKLGDELATFSNN